MVLDFGELKNDIDFIDKITATNGSIDKIEDKINKVVSYQNYDNLNTQERVKLDLFLSYASNSLFWMFLKLQGIDPNTVSFFFFFLKYYYNFWTKCNVLMGTRSSIIIFGLIK